MPSDAITPEMVNAAEEAVYPRHERGFLMKPLVGAIDMRAALTAALAQGVGVKPLEWSVSEDGGVYEAYSVLGRYSVSRWPDDQTYTVNGTKGEYLAEDVGLEEGQGIAQSDFNQRIRSALVAGAVEAEPSRDRKRAKEEILRDYHWGNLTRLGVANHLRRAGYKIEVAQDIANALPASPPEELERVKRERDEARAEAEKQKGRLFRQIDFTGELQRLLWALAEGNPLPETIKDSHAYTVASRAKARAETAESQLAEARAQLAALSREGGE